MDYRSSLYGWLIKVGLIVILVIMVYIGAHIQNAFSGKYSRLIAKYIIKPLAYIFLVIVVAALIIL